MCLVADERAAEPPYEALDLSDDSMTAHPASPKETQTRPLTGFAARDALALLDWKHQVFQLYADIRSEHDPETAWRNWRATRDLLFRDHPQSPLSSEAREAFSGCDYFDYDPAWRVTAEVVDTEPVPRIIAASTNGTFGFTRIGLARFHFGDERELALELAWNEGYGGGIFLAFTDGTTGVDTYGGGRYLLDTVKGSDLGFDRESGTLVLDFNFAYNPSCSYDQRWSCPLAPQANRIPLPVTAGERHRSSP